jgi:hypothetical protein
VRNAALSLGLDRVCNTTTILMYNYLTYQSTAECSGYLHLVKPYRPADMGVLMLSACCSGEQCVVVRDCVMSR